MTDFVITYWPFLLLVGGFAAAALIHRGEQRTARARRQLADRPSRRAGAATTRVPVIQAGGGFRHGETTARMAEAIAAHNGRPLGGVDNVVPLRSREEVRRVDDAS